MHIKNSLPRLNFIFFIHFRSYFIILNTKNKKKIYVHIIHFTQKVISTGFLRPPKSKVTFRPIFRERRATQKSALHYKPCPLTSLSSRKSWDIFAFSSEKIDFLIFAYSNFRGHLKKVIQQKGYVRFGWNFFFRLSSVIFKIFRGQNFNLGLNSKNI